MISSGLYKADNKGSLISSRGVLSGNVMPNGYRFYTLRYKGKSIGVYGHQFVYLFFKGSYDSKKVINHKDENKLNNAIENLECITQRENLPHVVKNKFRLHAGRAERLGDLAKDKIIDLYTQGYSMVRISKMFGITRQTVSKYCKQ